MKNSNFIFGVAFVALMFVSGCQMGEMQTLNSSQGSQSIPLGPPPADSKSLGLMRLGTHQYVGSVLTDIFGPSVAADIDRLVHQQVDSFGGACDSNIPGDCLKTFHTQLIYPIAPSSRAALTIRVCEKIVSRDTAVEFAAQQILGTTRGATQIPSQQDLIKAYDLFYTGQPLDPSVTAALKAVVDRSQTLAYPALEAWRFVLLSLCMSPEWQVL